MVLWVPQVPESSVGSIHFLPILVAIDFSSLSLQLESSQHCTLGCGLWTWTLPSGSEGQR